MTRRIYLDYASTTPLDKKVRKAMMPYFSKLYGNPSALYKEALVAKEAVRDARQGVARLLNIRPEEVIFTASGTEADNAALLGVFMAFKKLLKKEEVPHIVTTVIEHPGILEMCRHIETLGGEVTYVPVEENGVVDVNKIEAALKPTTVLVSIMLANNEIGTIQPVRDIARMLAEFRKKRVGESVLYPYLHTDASQAGNYLDLSFQKHGVDMMTLDGSKIYGPKGVGILAVRKHVAIEPIIHGGGQERGMRAGTENVPGIVGFTKALEITQALREKESKRLEKLQDYFISSVLNTYPGITLNGDRLQRLPNNVNICIPGSDAEFMVIKLDTAGIAASAASACMNLSEHSESYVIEALSKGTGNQEKTCSSSSIRFTFGRATSLKDIRLTLKVLQSIITTQ
jgi:cysteine desulfurase